MVLKITFLGTSAAELYPGVWCNCDYCRYAREHGGRNLRQYSSIHFAEKCLIDIPPGLSTRALRYNVDLLRTELLLCTHSHEDHFNPLQLSWRYMPYGIDPYNSKVVGNIQSARYTDLPLMKIYGNRRILAKMQTFLQNRELVDYAMDFTIPEAYREYSYAGVDFTPMIANHIDTDGERGLIYLIHVQGKTFLYATDSGIYPERTRDCIRAHKVDAVIREGTYGHIKWNERHMSLADVEKELEFYIENDIFKGTPRIYLTHLSPHRTPPYDMLCDIYKDSPIESAYDGMVLEL